MIGVRSVTVKSSSASRFTQLMSAFGGNADMPKARLVCDEGHNFSIQNLIAQFYPINSLARVTLASRFCARTLSPELNDSGPTPGSCCADA